MYLYKRRSVDPNLNYYRGFVGAPPGSRTSCWSCPSQATSSRTSSVSDSGASSIVIAGTGEAPSCPRFGEITDPKHRNQVLPLPPPEQPEEHPLRRWWSPTRGVVLAYLVREQKDTLDWTDARLPEDHPERGLVVGLFVFLPRSAVKDDKVLVFMVFEEDDRVAAVDVPAATP